MKSFTAGKNDDGVRLSRFVESVTTNMPKSLLHKSFRNKRIKVNGKKQDADYRIALGDVLELYINDEFFADNPQPQVQKKQVKMDIVFEDENIAVLYKPVHLLCHSDKTGDADLAGGFLSYLEQNGEFVKDESQSFTPALCNRLDRGTEGLVLGGKTYAAVRDLNQIIRDNLVDKTYYCIGVGNIKKGIYTAYLRHFEKDNKVDIKPYEQNDYKKIITQIEPVSAKGPFTLFKVGLITGRTHQIRAHLAFLGAPILGDIKYGNRKMNERVGYKTQALCAFSVSFKALPPENTLSYLSQKEFALSVCDVLKKFENL